MVIRGIRTFIDKFDRAQAFTTTPGMNGWTIADTSAAGTPTYLCVTEDGGGAALTLASNSEAENVCLFFNDVLPYDIRMLQCVWWTIKFNAQADAVTTLVAGVGSARNDTPDSVAVNAWFRVEGSANTSNLVCETDDATTDNDDKASGATLTTGYKKLLIDFTGGLSDVRFFVDGARVATGTTFNMSAVAAGQNVQPILQLQKASGTGVPAVQIAEFGAQFSWALGS